MSEITLPILANHFHISRSHLSRTFKKVTGLTIVEYLNSVRISQAQKLLRNTKNLFPKLVLIQALTTSRISIELLRK